jgi:hypothetical protein
MRFLRRIREITRIDEIKPIKLDTGERELYWLGHIHRMKDERLTREIYESREQGKNQIERPPLRCEDQMRQEAKNEEYNKRRQDVWHRIEIFGKGR